MEVSMKEENYCYKCGAHTMIGLVDRLCETCYGKWLSAVRHVGLD